MGEKVYVELSLQSAEGEVLSANDYFMLIADKTVDKAKLRAIGMEAFEIKQKYGWANYFRYFPGLGGEDGQAEADQQRPIARGFEQ